MKNLVRKLCLTTLLLVVLAVFLSCSKQEQRSPIYQLNEKMAELENRIISGFVVKGFYGSEIKNKDYFLKLDELIKTRDTSFNAQKLNELIKYNFQSQAFDPVTRERVKASYGNEESIFYTSLYRSIKQYKESSIDVIDTYLAEIQCTPISKINQTRISNTLLFLRDVYLYFNYNSNEILSSEESKGNQELLHKKYHCPYRDCFDCCMNTKLHEMEDNNVIEWIGVIVSFPESLGWLLSACGWDCIFHNKE